jgi:type IV secretory pathway VirJ component
MRDKMAQRIALLWPLLILLSVASGGAKAPDGSTLMHFVEFGDVPVFHPAGEPSQVVILLSGDQGVGAQEAEIGKALAALGALVLAVDAPRYAGTVAKSGAQCFYPGAELEELSQNGQARNGLTSYHTPILMGVGTGGTLAFASLSQSPPGHFAGALSLGFCPLLMIQQPLCHSGGLRWDQKWAGPGVRLLPDRRLEAPWIVLDTPGLPAGCPAAVAEDHLRDIVPAVRTASRVPLPAGLSPEAAESAWRAELGPALTTLVEKHKEADAARRAHFGELADLPLVEVPAAAPEADALAFQLTGSGGYQGIDVEIGQAVAAQGVPLVVLSSLDYFWKNRTPAQMGRDLARILDHYLAAWHKEKAFLFGYSQGADIVPFMVNRLPARLRSRIGAIGLLGPDPAAELDNGLSGYSTTRKAPPPLAVGPETARIKNRKVVCVYGKQERRSLCPRLDPKLGIDVFAVPGGHAFHGAIPPLMIAHVLQAGGLAVRPAAQMPQKLEVKP